MSDQPCQHKVLCHLGETAPGARVTVTPCIEHSQATTGIAVWTWSTQPLPPLRCSCDIADGRFFIATHEADAWGTDRAEVVIGAPRPTVHAAVRSATRRFPGLPGCSLIAVPAGRRGTVFRTRTDHIVVPAQQTDPLVCEVCLYPWLAAGHPLADVAAHLPAARATQMLRTGRAR